LINNGFRRSFEGLSLDGLLAHIINAITLFNSKVGTKNDCQLVVNFLIRKYHNRLFKKGILKIQQTKEARDAIAKGEMVIREHAIPVACIMSILIEDDSIGKDDLIKVTEKVKSFLNCSAKIVLISKREDGLLKSAGLDYSMPSGFESPPWKEPFVRYRVAKLSEIID
jgi:hypothetical protein